MKALAKRAAWAVAAVSIATSSAACSQSYTALPIAQSDAQSAEPVNADPYLKALTVRSSSDQSVIALTPSFSPRVFDYYVWCADGGTDVTVSLTASEGAMATLRMPEGSRPASSQSASFHLLEDQAIVAAAAVGSQENEYWVRCLPHDMPRWTWTAHPENGPLTPGYYLLGNLYPPVGGGGYALVMDEHGVPVWYQRASDGLGAGDVDSFGPGMISFQSADLDAIGPFQILNLSSGGVTMTPTSEALIHEYAPTIHDLRLLPNGDYIIVGAPLLTGVNLTGLNVGSTATPRLIWRPNATIADCVLVELNPRGSVVWTWKASDHFDAAQVATIPYDNGSFYDVFHCNSMDVDPTNGNLLVSARNMSSIFYVEYPSGIVRWKMGGANSSIDNAKYVSVADPFVGQHDARFQPGWSSRCNGGSGQISVFDDQYGTSHSARGVVYDVVVGSPLEQSDGGAEDSSATCNRTGASGTATLAWQYEGMSSSWIMGSFRISTDGSRVIGWGIGGSSFAFNEVDVDGKDLLDFSYVDGDRTYRVVKVPEITFDRNVLRSKAGQ